MSQAGPLNVKGGGGTSQVVQQVRANFQGLSSTNANFGNINTTPQISGGTQLFSLSITPTSASHVLVFECFVPTSNNGSASLIALFQNPTANALASCSCGISAGNLNLTYSQTAGSTSALTFSIRYGTPADGAGTMYVNDTNLGAGSLNNNINSTFTITEYVA